MENESSKSEVVMPSQKSLFDFVKSEDIFKGISYEQRKKIARAFQRSRVYGMKGIMRREEAIKRFDKKIIGQLIREGWLYEPRMGFLKRTGGRQ